MLRSEIEIMNDSSRRNYIYKQIQQISPNLSLTEKKLVVANLE